MALSIRRTLQAVLIALSIVSFTNIALDFRAIRTLSENIHHLKADEITHLEGLKAISDAYAVTIVDATHKAADGLLSKEESIANIASARKTIRERWQSFKSVQGLSAAEVALIAEYEKRMTLAEPVLHEIEKAILAGDRAASARLRATSMYPAIDPLTEMIDKLAQAQINSAGELLSVSEDVGTHATRVQIAVSSLLLLLTLAGFWFISHRVVNPLDRLRESMTRLANDEVDIDIADHRNKSEIGAMARAVETFRLGAVERKRLEKRAVEEREMEVRRQNKTEALIRDFRGAISTIRSTLDTELDGMQQSSTELTRIASDAAEGANSAQNASNESSSNVSHVANAAGELTMASREISTQVHKASECVTQAMSVAAKADEGISGLAELADRIGAIVVLINGIAEQTNMLALNATIEAARAGEAGRSFAVVASEVKTLASQTAQATDEISQQVTTIQQATQGAVQLIRSISTTVGDIQGRTAAIAAAVEQQEASTHEISRSISLASTGSERVANDVSSMAQAVDRTSNEAATLKSTTTKLADVAGELSRSVDEFLDGVTQDVSERRQSTRRATREFVIIVNGNQRMRTRAVDISESGLRVELAQSVPVGAKIEIEFLSGERHAARIAWWKDGQAGLQLAERVPQVLVEAMAA